jgi:hypothetical protein
LSRKSARNVKNLTFAIDIVNSYVEWKSESNSSKQDNASFIESGRLKVEVGI